MVAVHVAEAFPLFFGRVEPARRHTERPEDVFFDIFGESHTGADLDDRREDVVAEAVAVAGAGIEEQRGLGHRRHDADGVRARRPPRLEDVRGVEVVVHAAGHGEEVYESDRDFGRAERAVALHDRHVLGGKRRDVFVDPVVERDLSLLDQAHRGRAGDDLRAGEYPVEVVGRGRSRLFGVGVPDRAGIDLLSVDCHRYLRRREPQRRER